MMRACLTLSALLALGAWAVVADSLGPWSSGGAGNGINGNGVRPEPWIPYPTADSFVWAADACLGFFMTREPRAFGRGKVTARDGHGLEIELGPMEARILLRDVPPGDGGAFHCNSMRWPEMAPSPERLDAVALWIGDRLRSGEGWLGWFEAGNPEGRRTWTIAEYRNEALGVTLRVEARHEHPRRRDYLSVSLLSDGPGPPEVPD